LYAKHLLPLSYFHTITLIKPAFLQNHFPDLIKEPLFTNPPFSNFKEICTIGMQQGMLTNIASPVSGIKLWSVHPLIKQQCLKTLQHPDNQSQQIENFFIFIEYQYRIIYLLNEWIHHPDWQQAQLAQQILAIEEENLRSYFDATLKDNQSFLGALGLLNIHYQLLNQTALRKKLLNRVLRHYEATSKETYDSETYKEFPQALLFVGDTFFDDQQFAEALQQYQTALKLFGHIEPADEEWVLFLSCQKALSVLSAERNRDFEQASWWIHKGLEYLQEKEHLSHKIALHQVLGNLYLQFDVYEKAKQEWLTVLAYYKEIADEKAQADIHNNLGALYFTLGDNRSAKKHYKQALAYYLPLEDEFIKAELLSNLGAATSNPEEIPEHQSYFQQALTIYQTQKNPLKIAQVYQGLGSMEESLENYQASTTLYHKALTIFQAQEEEDSVGELLHNLGHLHFVNKAFSESEKYLLQALAIYQKRQDKSGIAEVYQNLGNLAYEKEADDTAKAYFENALNTFIELGDAFLEAGVRWNLGILYKNQAAYSQALNHFTTALSIFQSFQSDNDVMEVADEIAKLQLSLKQKQEALRYFNIALTASQKLGDVENSTYFRQQISTIQPI